MNLRVFALLLPLLLAACDQSQAPKGQTTPEVTVVVVQSQAVALTSDLPGRTTPYRVAEVRARVDGIVLKREFFEGSNVRTGQHLYLIDPAPYQAALSSANAGLAKAKANLVAKKLQSDRFNSLLTQKAISLQSHDDAVAAYRQAEADVTAAKAEVDAAQIKLGYTAVVSPLDGRIGKSLVTEGAYVRQGEATPMTTVLQLDPIYVDVAQSSADILRLRHELEQGHFQKSANNTAKVSLILEDGSIYPEAGELQFSASTVEESTGTVTLRALFPNSKLQLLPGMFVHARLEAGVNEKAILVSQQAVTFDAKGQATALIVGAEDKVELRTLQVSRSIDNQWLVTSGLQAGDRVIVEGLQRIHPGVAVTVVDKVTKSQ